MSSVSEDPAVLTKNMAELSWALSKLANDILGQSKPKGEIQAWADMTILTLLLKVRELIAGTIHRATNDPDSEVTGWGWKGEQKQILDKAIAPYLPKV